MKVPDAIVAVKSETDLDAAIAESSRRAVFVFKHSPACPVSGAAWAEFLDFARGAGSRAALRAIDVLAGRTVARLLAERTGVKHESPQALVLRGGKAVRHASHGDLVHAWFEDALAAEGGAR